MRTPLLLTAALLLVLPAAAHGQSQPAAGQVRRAAQHQRNRIEPDEIAQAHSSNAWDLVQSLRPTWLNRHNVKIRGAVAAQPMGGSRHGASSEGLRRDMMVLVDGTEYGDMQSLRDLSAHTIYSIEFLESAPLLARYGKESHDGAIVIHTSPDDDPGSRPTN